MPGCNPPAFPDGEFVVREAPIEAILAAAADLRKEQQQQQHLLPTPRLNAPLFSDSVLTADVHKQHPVVTVNVDKHVDQQQQQLSADEGRSKRGRRRLRRYLTDDDGAVLPRDLEGVIVAVADLSSGEFSSASSNRRRKRAQGDKAAGLARTLQVPRRGSQSSTGSHRNTDGVGRRGGGSVDRDGGRRQGEPRSRRMFPPVSIGVAERTRNDGLSADRRQRAARDAKGRYLGRRGEAHVYASSQYEASSDSQEHDNDTDQDIDTDTQTAVRPKLLGSGRARGHASDSESTNFRSAQPSGMDDDDDTGDTDDVDGEDDGGSGTGDADNDSREFVDASNNEDAEGSTKEGAGVDASAVPFSTAVVVGAKKQSRRRKGSRAVPTASFGDDFAEFAGVTDGEQQDGRLLYGGAFGLSGDVRSSIDVHADAVAPLADAFLMLAESEAEGTRRIEKEATMSAWPLSGEDTSDNAALSDTSDVTISVSSSDHCLVLRLPSAPNAITSPVGGARSDNEPGSLVCVHLMSLEDVATQERAIAGDDAFGLAEALDDSRDTRLQEYLLAANDDSQRHTHAGHTQGHLHHADLADAQLVVVTSLVLPSPQDGTFSREEFVEVGTMPLDSVQAAIAELRRRGTSNVLVIAFLMLLLWIAFNTVQGLLVKVDEKLGTAVLATYYLSNVVASFKVGAVLERFTPRAVLRVTWIPYVLFIGALVIHSFLLSDFSFVLSVIATAVVGIAAASMWTAQSMYVGFNSDATTMAKNQGYFHGIYMNNFLIANTSSALLLSFTSLEWSHLFMGAAVLACAAVVGSFLLLKPPSFVAPKNRSPEELQKELVVLQVSAPVAEGFLEEHAGDPSLQDPATAYLLSADDTNAQSPDHADELYLEDLHPAPVALEDAYNGAVTSATSVSQSSPGTMSKGGVARPSFMAAVWRDAVLLFSLHKLRSVRLVVAMWLYTGLFYSFLFGPLPLLLPINLVGFGLASFGVATVISATFFSWIVGTKGMIHPRTAVFIGAAVQCVTLCCAVVASSFSDPFTKGVFAFAAYVFEGLADGALNPNLLALVPASAPGSVAAAYNLFRVHQNLATASTYLLMRIFGFEVLALSILQACVLLIAVGFLWRHGPIIVTT